MNTRKDFHFYFGIALGVLAVATIALHIYMSGPTTTKIETTLFNVIEFGLSLGFAWFLSEYAARLSFHDSQRKFAISAYRRINEIDIGLDRLLSRLRHQIPQSPPEIRRELEVVLAMATSTSETIKFSIADWADIIGDELRTIRKISRIRDSKERLLEDALLTRPDRPNTGNESNILETLSDYQEQIARLVATLPPSLQLASEPFEDSGSGYESARSEVRDIIEANGEIELEGFWDSSFDKSILEYEVDDSLVVSFADAGSRIGTLIAHDPNNGERVGVITNCCRSARSYPEFASALADGLGSSTFTVVILDIETDLFGGRHYFSVLATAPRKSSRGSRVEPNDSEIEED